MIIDVINLNFDRLQFNRGYTEDRKVKGNVIHNQQDVKIDVVDQISDDEYHIKATVDGSSYNNYRVRLQIKNEIIDYCSCTCKDYEKGNICKHIIATVLEVIDPHQPSTQKERENEYKRRMEEERKRREYMKKYSLAMHTISNYMSKEENINFVNGLNDGGINLKALYEDTRMQKVQNNESNTLSTHVKIEPRIAMVDNNTLNLSLKIGETTMYVLKDLEGFYQAFENKDIITYGKKLELQHKKENFVLESQKLLDFVLDYAKMLNYNKKVQDDYRYYRSNTKEVILMDDKINEFFDICGDKLINFTNSQGDNNVYEVSNEEFRINVTYEKNNNENILKCDKANYEYVIANDKIYIFYQNKIYKHKKEDDLVNCLETFSYSNEMLIPDEMLEDFSTIVFPRLSKYMDISALPENVIKEGLIVNKLSAKMYLDLDPKDNIAMELKFCYLDTEFNILQKGFENELIENKIVRNILEEKKILERIFLDGFELEKNKQYFVLKNSDDMYEFLSDKINGYMNDFEVLVTDKLKNRKVRQAQISNIGIRIDSGLLNVDLSKIDIDVDEIKDVLKNYSVKKKYYQLKNGDFLDLSQNENLEVLNDISNTFDINYSKMQDGVIKLPVNRSIYLEKILDKNKSIKTVKNDEYTKLINNVENRNFSEDVKIDEKFDNILREYQKTGYKWLKVLKDYQFGGILADDMGLGKTLQVIALLNDEITNEDKKTSIVVCPSSLTLNWKAEIEKWCNEIRVKVIKGDAETRKGLIDNYNDYDLIITSYDSLKRDVFEYEGKTFKYVIADEAQYIKNSNTQNATALKSLVGETRYALTGTPIENSISELWSIFDFIMPGYLYSYSKFKKKFEEPILKFEDEDAVKRLKLMINPFVLRRVKTDVLTELPDKNITVMNNEMTSEQEKIYMSYLAQTKKEVASELNNSSFAKSKFKILMLLTRLRQICCHPSLFLENYNGGSGKLEQCLDIIEDAIEAGHKILLFSSYTSMFEILEKKLKEKGIEYYKLTGQTQVDKRIEMVEDFNNSKNVKIFLISLKAGGTGLNLTGADVVIHYDPWWNVSSENQATDRAYRIGQKNSVQVYKLITANSIEEKINRLQEKKAKISEQLLSTEETFVNKLSKEEIMDLFEI